LRFKGFIGPSYTLDSKNIDSQNCINFYPKVNEMGVGKASEVMSLIMTPGLSLLATLGSGPIRGVYKAKDNLLYVVSGDKFYRVNSSWAGVEIGTLNTSSGNVDFADNGTTLVIVDGDNGYYHTLSSTSLTEFSGAAWLGSTRVQYIDGYFIFNDPNTGKFYISGLNAVTLDALDFASADGAPDDIISTQVNHRELWLFGRDSIEGWYNSGNADFPFERIQSGFMEMGCDAAFSVAKIDRVTLWLGNNKDGHGIVYAAYGFEAQRVSTHAVEYAIQGYGDISNAIAWTYQENGHSFYVLNFPTPSKTWVYDLTTKLWHERAYFNDGVFNRHRGNSHVFVYNTHVLGDWENGKIYKLDQNTYTDNGDEIRRVRTAPHLSGSQKRIQYNSFELDLETGVGLISGQGSDPDIMLDYSDDGGHTWSNIKTRKIGKMGKRNTRVIWRRLGESRDRVFRISISDPVKVNLIGAEFEAIPLGG
jgi:hypothetical protein